MKGKGQGADVKVSMVWCAGWHGMGWERGFRIYLKNENGRGKKCMYLFFFLCICTHIDWDIFSSVL